MSLLNDALKKAQSAHGLQRPSFPAPTQPAVPQPPPEQAAAAVVQEQAAAATGTKAIVMVAGVVFVVTAGVLGVGGYFLLGRSQPAPAVVVASAPTPAPVAETQPVAPPEPVSAPPIPEPAQLEPMVQPGSQSQVQPTTAAVPPALGQPTPVTPVQATDQPTPPPRVEIAATEPVRPILEPVANETVEAGAATSVVASEERVPLSNVDGVIIEAVPRDVESPIRASGSQPDPAIEGWVAQIEVSGVRMGASPKVLMNDRVYTIGEIVDRKTKLKLTVIEPRMLSFEDPNGNTYELYF